MSVGHNRRVLQKNGLTDRKAVCDVDSDGPRKPRIRSLSRSSHGKGVSSPLEIIVIFCCTADGSPLLFPSAVFPIGVSEQFLNGTLAHNRPFQCHIPIGRSNVKFSPHQEISRMRCGLFLNYFEQSCSIHRDVVSTIDLPSDRQKNSSTVELIDLTYDAVKTTLYAHSLLHVGQP